MTRREKIDNHEQQNRIRKVIKMQEIYTNKNNGRGRERERQRVREKEREREFVE